MTSKQILIVEDEKPIRDMIAFGLRRAGYVVREAEDCGEARTRIVDSRPDLLIVDCAPTAETLRLLSLPEVMNWYIERIFPVERRVVKTLRPIVSKMTTLPIAGESFYTAVERLHRNLDAVHRILTDESSSTVRLVVNPE